MRNRTILVVVVIVILGLLFLPRLLRRSQSAGNKELLQEQSSDPQLDSQLEQAKSFEQKGSLIEAQELYQRLMEMPLSSEQLTDVQHRLEDLNVRILFSGIKIDGSQIYEVKQGDTLSQIAKKFNSTVDTIKQANNIKGSVIHPGMKLRVLTEKFTILVDKSQNILILKYKDAVVKTYIVSTGSNNSTPVGTYIIETKLIDPVWYKNGKAIPPTSPDNILGTRWMGFNLPGYGIHGTVAPQDLGKQITEGCVRMRNDEVEELYRLVPQGSEVVIID